MKFRKSLNAWFVCTPRTDDARATAAHCVDFKTSGASGGPIINESDELVGIVSWFSEGRPYQGSVPRPHLALPRWIVRRIAQGKGAGEA